MPTTARRLAPCSTKWRGRWRPSPATAPGLSRDWGSCRDGCWRMRIVGGLEALPEAGAERAVVDGAADLEQQVGPAPGPAHLLRLFIFFWFYLGLLRLPGIYVPRRTHMRHYVKLTNLNYG